MHHINIHGIYDFKRITFLRKFTKSIIYHFHLILISYPLISKISNTHHTPPISINSIVSRKSRVYSRFRKCNRKVHNFCLNYSPLSSTVLCCKVRILLKGRFHPLEPDVTPPTKNGFALRMNNSVSRRCFKISQTFGNVRERPLTIATLPPVSGRSSGSFR